MRDQMPLLLRGDARNLPLPDASVDLVVTSPPYWSLRDYGTDTQIGAEPTWEGYLDNLIDCSREWVRVLKPSGSLFVNLGDKYGPDKSLLDLPWRYGIRCRDELGLIKRAEIIWSKVNGLPESVVDRVRRSHEVFLHLTKLPRYFAAVDEIREPHAPPSGGRNGCRNGTATSIASEIAGMSRRGLEGARPDPNPLGKLPGSVWEVPTQPLKVPAELGVDHFAAFPMEWPRRLILGWSPREVCTACGEGRGPVTAKGAHEQAGHGGTEVGDSRRSAERLTTGGAATSTLRTAATRTITGYACACPDTTAPSTPGVVLDPFGGTGTTALVATMLGRRGISVDLSADYQRIATWRCSDPKERARAAGLDPDQVAAIKPQLQGQESLLDLLGGEVA